MKLTIISHTEHYQKVDGTIVGWGSTITEINHLAKHFDEITHVAMLHKDVIPSSSLPYLSSNIKFVALPVLGGKSFVSKLKIVANIPKIISIVSKELKNTDVFQFRAPTGIGIFLIPYFTLFVKTKGWYKYAGNWNQKNPPLAYRFQRWLFKKQKRPVTINGAWENQPKQCLTFENPCLTYNDFKEGKEIVSKKEYKALFSFCFVGRLEKPKGVERIIKAFTLLSEEEKKKIAEINFVGDGGEASYFKNLAKGSGVKMNFLGFQPRQKVFELYKRSHFFMLPSTASEGFPKVIAEAMNFGCLPIVSNVSSIGQYINSNNGFIVSPTTSENLAEIMKGILHQPTQNFKEKALEGRKVSIKFTFENYNKRIKNEIVNVVCGE